MTADEARQLTRQALDRDGAIKPLLEHVYGRIREAAARGERELAHPLFGYREPASLNLNSNRENAVYDALRRDGFKVEQHGDYSPDPRDAPYYVVSWQ